MKDDPDKMLILWSLDADLYYEGFKIEGNPEYEKELTESIDRSGIESFDEDYFYNEFLYLRMMEGFDSSF